MTLKDIGLLAASAGLGIGTFVVSRLNEKNNLNKVVEKAVKKINEANNSKPVEASEDEDLVDLDD